MRKFRFVLCFFLCLSGCEQYVPVASKPLKAVERDQMLVFILDTSESFKPQMFGGNQLAYRFFLKATDKFFQSGSDHQRILISQLSANSRILWEGAPLALRRRFGSSAALQQFVEASSSPAGSDVFSAVAATLDYVNELPGIDDADVCVCVLSDMLDNSSQQSDDRKQMIDSLNRFAQTKGCIGLYWVDQSCLKDVRHCLKDAGLNDRFVVESEFVEDPKLPFTE
jgi:hypothetical protein